MDLNSIGTFLMHKTGSGSEANWDKLVNIKTQPALGGAPEQLETTTLSNFMRTYIPGIESNDQKEFRCNYSKSDYEKIKALKGDELDLAVWLGGTVENGGITPTGVDGKFAFKGFVDVYVNEVEVNGVREMTVVVTASSEIEES